MLFTISSLDLTATELFALAAVMMAASIVERLPSPKGNVWAKVFYRMAVVTMVFAVITRLVPLIG